ncbi:hypothetical protein BSKO_02231 [Bryopsis sp. KO-2023]|nr:hypothetical protein BSKO_02231 [Bryopsis sp. KO-2023]
MPKARREEDASDGEEDLREKKKQKIDTPEPKEEGGECFTGDEKMLMMPAVPYESSGDEDSDTGESSDDDMEKDFESAMESAMEVVFESEQSGVKEEEEEEREGGDEPRSKQETSVKQEEASDPCGLDAGEEEDCKIKEETDVVKEEEKSKKGKSKKGAKPASKPKAKTPKAKAAPKKKPEKKAAAEAQASRLPPGWLDCPPMGASVGRMIPCKVPLGPHFNDVVPEEQRFNPSIAYNMIQERGLQLGLVIDLTNSYRYYDPAEWEDNGVQYAKIPCKGRGETPDPVSVNQFVWTVYCFLNECPDNHVQILVHCTHGFNRTGFMLVSTMMRLVDNMTIASLINSFAKKRAPGIYKDDYIEELFSYYHEPRPESTKTPAVPDWKGVGDDEEEGEGSGSANAASRRDCHTSKKEIHHETPVGEQIAHSEQEEYKKFIIAQMLGEDSHFTRFPGSQPVSLDRNNLPLLRDRRYWVTWKADGTRYMVLLMSFGVYLIDRKFEFRRVQMRLPREFVQCSSPNNAKMCHGTILDGEMVVDRDPETGLYYRRFLVYDLMVLAGESLMHLPFKDRFSKIDGLLMLGKREARDIAEGRAKYKYKYSEETFRIRRKDFWPLAHTKKIFHMMEQLCHECDGLILQAYEDPYVVGTCHELLKWKFAHLNSVDFRMRLGEDGEPVLLLFRNRREVPLDNGKIEFPNNDGHRFDGKIVECSYDAKASKWIFLRERFDKSTPNAFHVYQKVLNSIRDDISKDELLVHINRSFRESDVYRSDRARLPNAQPKPRNA